MQNFKPFRPWQLDQAALLPYSPREWLEDDRKKKDFLLDLVDELDLSKILILAQVKAPSGEKVCGPRISVKLSA
jgi:hypothetical protein